ncbi:MAG: transporter substrate-binding domain-containing protein [Nitrospirae bacterium]|nr:transporter substrate-binding domain-containing protein [Nitrospirota bacterium]
MNKILKAVISAFILTVCLIFFQSAGAAHTYTVGFVPEPCYISTAPNGEVEGLIADIWREIAKRASLNYTLREFKDASELKEKVTSGEVDFFLNGINRSSKNADIAAFSHVYHVSHLSILLIKAWNLRFIDNFKAISIAWSGIVMQIFLVFIIVVFIYAHILWLLEKETSMRKGYKHGIVDAMWCVVATETTIGFGDIVPKSLWARLFSVLVWFTGVMLVTLISAEIISEFSTNKINCTIRKFSELKNNTIAVPNVPGIIDTIKGVGAKPMVVSNYKDVYDILKTGKADAAVLYYLQAVALANQAFKNGLDPDIIKNTMYELQWQLGISRSGFDKRLFDEINLIIFDMRGDGTFGAINDKWLSLELR